ncbi:MAG: SDR family oxidoreductase [Marinobacterium sp.]|nr:SDR family oxidoreductase [Marinobacterium sp.]
MRVLVWGASRGVGLLVAQQALEAGHTVTAVARRQIPLGGCESTLTMRRANIEDRFSVQSLVAGHDAVVISIGALPGFTPVYSFSLGTSHVIEAMQRAGVRRLVVVTGIGAGDSRGHGGFLYDRLFLPFVLGRVYRDKDRQERLVRESQLDWTLVRPGFLTHGPRTANYQVHTDLRGIKAGKISRADVAHFIIHSLNERCWYQQSPLLGCAV